MGRKKQHRDYLIIASYRRRLVQISGWEREALHQLNDAYEGSFRAKT
jgi:hypothetical protein